MIRDDSKQVLLSVFGVALLIVAIVGISYAIFVFSAKSRVDNTVRSGGITFEYLEGDSVIDINDALPVSDEVGVKQTKSFDFQVSSAIRGNTTVFYEVRAKSLTVDNKIDNQYVKIYLEKKDGGDFSTVLSPTAFKENPNTSLTNISLLIKKFKYPPATSIFVIWFSSTWIFSFISLAIIGGALCNSLANLKHGNA